MGLVGPRLVAGLVLRPDVAQLLFEEPAEFADRLLSANQDNVGLWAPTAVTLQPPRQTAVTARPPAPDIYCFVSDVDGATLGRDIHGVQRAPVQYRHRLPSTGSVYQSGPALLGRGERARITNKLRKPAATKNIPIHSIGVISSTGLTGGRDAAALAK